MRPIAFLPLFSLVSSVEFSSCTRDKLFHASNGLLDRNDDDDDDDDDINSISNRIKIKIK